jgi:3-oxoacyl-[acyl-carrier protein] reductase
MKPGARIVNIASVATTHGSAKQAVYCASKFGVDGFAEALNQEVIERGISITTICPGGIDTPLWKPATPYPGGDVSKLLASGDIADLVEYVANLPERVVLKRLTLFPSNEWH